MAFCDFHPHPASPFPKHPQALACTSPHLRSHSAQCPPPGMPLPSTFQLARTRGNELLTETSMGPNESIPHPLPLPALCEGLPQMGLSFPWRCGNQDLGVSALLPAVPSSVPGTGLRPRKQTPGQILEPSLPGARPCTCNLTFRTRSPPPRPDLSDGDRFPSGDEEMVRGVSEFTPPKGTWRHVPGMLPQILAFIIFITKTVVILGGWWLFIK